MIEIEVEAEAWTGALPDAEAVVETAAKAALGTIEGDIVVLLTDDESVRELNARFRDKDRPTNVLSFPAPDNAAPSTVIRIDCVPPRSTASGPCATLTAAGVTCVTWPVSGRGASQGAWHGDAADVVGRCAPPAPSRFSAGGRIVA